MYDRSSYLFPAGYACFCLSSQDASSAWSRRVGAAVDPGSGEVEQAGPPGIKYELRSDIESYKVQTQRFLVERTARTPGGASAAQQAFGQAGSCGWRKSQLHAMNM